MQRFSIAVIPGDGVGQEVVPAALRVLEAIGPRYDAGFDLQTFDWGAEYYFRNGRMMPADALDRDSRHGVHQGVVADVEDPGDYSVDELVRGADVKSRSKTSARWSPSSTSTACS